MITFDRLVAMLRVLPADALVVLFIGVIATVVALVSRSTGATRSPIRGIGLAGGIAVLAVWVGTATLSGIIRQPLEVWWWAFTPPLVAAIATIAVALVIVARTPVRPQVPITPVRPRGWLSFTRRRDWVTATVVLATLVLTSVIAGAASAPDEHGWYSTIEIPVGTLEPGFASFFGWAYGLPVLVAAAVLAAVVSWALHLSAARPFIRPETVETETTERRALSSVLVAVMLGATLLVLGDAVRLIAGAGMGSVGVGIPGIGDFNYSTGYAAFAPAMYALSYVVQIWAIALLLITATGRTFRLRRAAA